jgi:hypothetical protein
MIPLVTGNLSVEYLMKSLAGGPRPEPGAHRDELAAFAQLGVGAVEDYVAWGVVERREGVFDWSFHRENLAQCRRLGLRYVVYPWLHVVPDWHFESGRFVGYRCRSTTASAASLFDPAFFERARRSTPSSRRRRNGIDVSRLPPTTASGYPTGFGLGSAASIRRATRRRLLCGDVRARRVRAPRWSATAA